MYKIKLKLKIAFRSQQSSFLTIWLAITCSQFGSGISAFSLGYWVLDQTGSIVQFGFIIFLSSIIGCITSPLAGWAVDLFDKKKIILLGESVACIIIFLLLTLNNFHLLTVKFIYIAVLITSFFVTFAAVAYQAIIPELMPENAYQKSAGLMQMSFALFRVSGPLIGGALMQYYSLSECLEIDVVSYLASIGLLFLTLRQNKTTIKSTTNTRSDARNSFFTGYNVIKTSMPFKTLLFVGAFLNFVTASFFVLLTPMAFSLGNTLDIGVIVSAIGIGGGIGGVLLRANWCCMSPTKGLLITVYLMIASLFLFVVPTGSLTLICIAIFFSMSNTMATGYCHLLYLKFLQNHLLGRVLSLRHLVNMFSLSIGYIFAPLTINFISTTHLYLNTHFFEKGLQLLPYKLYFIALSMTLLTIIALLKNNLYRLSKAETKGC